MRRLAFLCGVWLLAGACNAPTIPLPPPGPETIEATPDAAGDRLSFRGGPDSVPGRSFVTVFDVDTGRGALVRADEDGSWQTDPITARPGDQVEVSHQTRDGEVSDVLCLRVRVGRQGNADRCEAPQAASATPDGGAR